MTTLYEFDTTLQRFREVYGPRIQATVERAKRYNPNDQGGGTRDSRKPGPLPPGAKHRPCLNCGGSGIQPPRHWYYAASSCPDCNGTGHV